MNDNPMNGNPMNGARWLRWAGSGSGSGDGNGNGDGLRLFCFPHAGAGPAQFVGWADGMGPDIDVAGVCLPGREQRINESPIRRMDPLVARLATEIGPYLRPPYALFGHSLGAQVAFALAHHMERLGRGPAHLFVSSARAPHVPSGEPPAHTLDDESLLAHTRALDGLPAEVLAQRDLIQLTLPALRADFELSETYRPEPTTTVRCPITALGGAHDRSVPVAALRCWKDLTTGPYGVIELPGGHFYLIEHERHVVRLIRSRLAATHPSDLSSEEVSP
jgi:medium-chain acyl-[acyl-carrier-protein] hydrolase